MVETLTLFARDPQFWIEEEVRKRPVHIRPPNILPIPRKGKAVMYQLYEHWRIVTPLGTFFVPAGFIIDGASVPRPLWPFWTPDGRHRAAAVLHDWLYANQGMVWGERNGVMTWISMERWEADRLFLWACRQFKVGGAWLMWLGLKIGGGSAWDSYSSKEPIIEPLYYEFDQNRPHAFPRHNSISPILSRRIYAPYVPGEIVPCAATVHLDLRPSQLR